jgi:integrase/recombinase XerD
MGHGLLLQTRIRPSELAGLQVSDVEPLAKIDREHTRAVDVNGKGHKERTITLNHKACPALRNNLRERPKFDEDALFLTRLGLPIGPRPIGNIAVKYAAPAGITDAPPHSLRHIFAIHHIKKGTSLASGRTALGDENLATRSLYIGLAREQMDKEL